MLTVCSRCIKFWFSFLFISHSCFMGTILGLIASVIVYLLTHYENMPMQYTAIIHGCKKIFHIFAQNIECGYKLEPPQ